MQMQHAHLLEIRPGVRVVSVCDVSKHITRMGPKCVLHIWRTSSSLNAYFPLLLKLTSKSTGMWHEQIDSIKFGPKLIV